VGGPSGDSPFYRVLELVFPTFDLLDAALTSPEGVAAGKDLMDYAGDVVELLFVEASDELTDKPLGPDNLQAYLNEHNISAEIVYPGAPTPTVPAAAEALGVDPDQIVKSVLFLVDDQPFLVYGCGVRLVDHTRLADRLSVSRKKVKLANADQVLNLTGYAVGTVPPVGLKTPMPAFMDPAVLEHDVVYAGGGGINALLKIESQILQRISRAEVAPMLKPPDDGTAGEKTGSDEAQS
jgi:prolyl-tRNA editing enzyme YbaK/EbsC (Cys-tRNA(Pro) deacylase)